MAVIKASKRPELGTRRVRRLRAKGLIPGVVYGHGEEPQSITLSEHAVELAVLHGERLLELEVDGKKQNVLIKDVQYDTFGHTVLHVDLARVDLDERVEVTVPIVLKGTPIGVTDEEGVLQQTTTEVTVECPVRAIPDEIAVMVTDLHVGETLNVGDLPLPQGAKILGDAETNVASVRVVTEEVEEEAVAAETSAEPEVIGEKPEAEGEESPAGS